jgi:hypothetical protein
MVLRRLSREIREEGWDQSGGEVAEDADRAGDVAVSEMDEPEVEGGEMPSGHDFGELRFA